VRYDLVEGDLKSVSASINTGVLRPWSLVNLGRDFDLATAWALPDPDEQALLLSFAARNDAFNKAIKEYRENMFVIDQSMVDRLALQYGVDSQRLAEPPTDVT
jgi:hypothetical protein